MLRATARRSADFGSAVLGCYGESAATTFRGQIHARHYTRRTTQRKEFRRLLRGDWQYNYANSLDRRLPPCATNFVDSTRTCLSKIATATCLGSQLPPVYCTPKPNWKIFENFRIAGHLCCQSICQFEHNKRAHQWCHQMDKLSTARTQTDIRLPSRLSLRSSVRRPRRSALS